MIIICKRHDDKKLITYLISKLVFNIILKIYTLCNSLSLAFTLTLCTT